MAAVSTPPVEDRLPPRRSFSFSRKIAAPVTVANRRSSQQTRPMNNNNFLPNGAPSGPSGPVPGARPLLPNHGQVIEAGPTRILCVADVRGNLKSLNDLAKAARADCIIHTGDFGFYDDRSLERIAEKTLKHVAQYSPLISEEVRRQIVQSPPNQSIKQRFPASQLPLSQLPQFLNGSLTFDVPVYTVWGACEDVQVLERIRSSEYKINNLHVIDEENTRKLEVNGVKIRLLGLGGAVVMHKLFDNGEGRTTIAGGQGTMWTTFLQIGMLISTAMAAYDPSETRVLVTHASPSREGLLNQLAVHLKVDFSISAGLHFRYGSSYNEFSVNPGFDHYRGKLAASKSSFNDVWETVKSEVEPVVAQDETQNRCLQNALAVVDRMPSVATGGGPFSSQGASEDVESAFKNMWNFNLSDAAFGYLVLEVESGRVAAEMKSQGFNFGHRGNKALMGAAQDAMKVGAPSPAGAGIGAPPSGPPQVHAPTGPQQGPGPQAQPAVAKPPQPAAAPVEQVAKGPAPASNGVVDAKANGAADGVAPKDAPSPVPVEKKPSQAIFVQGGTSEEEVRSMFAEADRGKIERIEQKGQNSVAHFSSPEEMKAVFDNAPEASKKRTQGRPTIKVFEDRRSNYQAGTWGSGRGGGQQGGYRSGGASDSEGGRGRGGFRGGRGRGGDRGRGGRGGRGGFKGPGEGSGAPSPAPAQAS